MLDPQHAPDLDQVLLRAAARHAAAVQGGQARRLDGHHPVVRGHGRIQAPALECRLTGVVNRCWSGPAARRVTSSNFPTRCALPSTLQGYSTACHGLSSIVSVGSPIISETLRASVPTIICYHMLSCAVTTCCRALSPVVMHRALRMRSGSICSGSRATTACSGSPAPRSARYGVLTCLVIACHIQTFTGPDKAGKTDKADKADKS